MRQDFAGLNVVRQLEGEELQFFLDVLHASAHQAFDE